MTDSSLKRSTISCCSTSVSPPCRIATCVGSGRGPCGSLLLQPAQRGDPFGEDHGSLGLCPCRRRSPSGARRSASYFADWLAEAAVGRAPRAARARPPPLRASSSSWPRRFGRSLTRRLERGGRRQERLRQRPREQRARSRLSTATAACGGMQPDCVELAGDLVLDRRWRRPACCRGSQPLGPVGADVRSATSGLCRWRRMTSRRTSSSMRSPSGRDGARLEHAGSARRRIPALPLCGVARGEDQRVACGVPSSRASRLFWVALVTLCDSSMTTASQCCLRRWAR